MSFHKKRLFLSFVFYSLLAGGALQAGGSKGFAIENKEGKYITVTFNGKNVARYMYEHDTSTKEKLHETYKPYLHIFDAAGKKTITKGPGGLYTHHRGIFIGWNRIQFKGRRYDRWHMKGGEIVHQSFEKLEADPGGATIISITAWNDNEGNPILKERRTMEFGCGPEAVRLQVDFTSKLTASYGMITLNGDPEHAGVQYRPGNEVVKKETKYFFPKEGADPRKDLDYPWVGESYTIFGKRYSVVHLNHPQNPKKTKYSAYRDYGRFGAFFEKEIPEGESLTVAYRFLIADGEMLPKKVIEKSWKKFAEGE